MHRHSRKLWCHYSTRLLDASDASSSPSSFHTIPDTGIASESGTLQGKLNWVQVERSRFFWTSVCFLFPYVFPSASFNEVSRQVLTHSGGEMCGVYCGFRGRFYHMIGLKHIETTPHCPSMFGTSFAAKRDVIRARCPHSKE